MSLILYLNSCM